MENEFERELKLLRSGGLKDSELRLEYERKVRGLGTFRDLLRASGSSEEETAKKLHNERRRLGKEYKDAALPLLREYILYATENKYGDPLGPDYETLRKYKTAAEIIESASRPIRDLDERLSIDGFIKWYHEVYSTGEEKRNFNE